MKEEYVRLLGRLQTLDFFLLELNLHLASDPHDPLAIQKKRDIHQIRQELKEQTRQFPEWIVPHLDSEKWEDSR
ncbi:hypothetical protein [Desmospora profundinema]|uniref:Uncharacterized protein n=1 Tax=Desmospora profundinema TaxID=1571184 RepID=A0ABU1IKE6_9BACL|nr:hypothetical protein [Desmospora profundinema]MDR6225257.1 hypothetical protein [Desmospora profundinema]